MEMNRLRDAAASIYGRQRWVTELSHRVSISASTLRRWAKSEGNPPHADVEQRIYDALLARVYEAAFSVRMLFPARVSISLVGDNLVVSFSRAASVAREAE